MNFFSRHSASNLKPISDNFLGVGVLVKVISSGKIGLIVEKINNGLFRIFFKEVTKVDYTSMILPLMRRVSYSTIASQIVSVQPMQTPNSLIFHNNEEDNKN